MRTTRRDGGWRLVTLSMGILFILLFWMVFLLQQGMQQLGMYGAGGKVDAGERRLGAVNTHEPTSRSKATGSIHLFHVLPCLPG